MISVLVIGLVSIDVVFASLEIQCFSKGGCLGTASTSRVIISTTRCISISGRRSCRLYTGGSGCMFTR